jgi:hypothetical protein
VVTTGTWTFQHNEKKITLNNIEELLVKPAGFEIKNSHIHGITHELADKYGMEISNVLKIFAKFIDETDYIIGYNIFFDINIMLNELGAKTLGVNCFITTAPIGTGVLAVSVATQAGATVIFQGDVNTDFSFMVVYF